MIELHRILLTYLLNSVWQVPLIACAALLCSLLLRKASPSIQHRVWVGTLAVCVLLPLAATNGWLASTFRPAAFHGYQKATSTITLLLDSDSPRHPPGSHTSLLFLAPSLGNLLLMLWFAVVLFRAASLTWAWRRVLFLARESRCAPHSPGIDVLWGAAQARFRLADTRLLFSDRIAAPATLNAPDPVLLLPSSLASQASDVELAAIFAHESAHIHRLDFLLNLLYEVLALPIVYHPVVLFLRTRITESRELVCDQMAATSLGDAAAYARSLVHIAEVLSKAVRNPIPALGIFEGGNLEKRIMTLLDRKPRLSRLSTATLIVFCSLIFGSCCVAATAFDFQPAAIVSGDLKPYAGAWHWMFKGKPFVTMTLIPEGDHFTGSMTNGFFKNDADGAIIDAGSNPGTSSITRTFFAGKVLHIIVSDDKDNSLSEWTMTLLSPGHAQFFTADAGAPKNLKPWLAERVSDPAVSETDAAGSPVYKIGGAVLAPQLTYGPDPEFSDEARKKKMQGVVVVQMIVDASGKPQDVRIVRALGMGLDEKAVEAVKQYKFKPATLNGKPVAAEIKVEVNFRRY